MTDCEPIRGREAFAAYALLVAAGLGVGVMAMHPHGHELRDAIDGTAVVARNRVVHAVAIVAVLLQTSAALALVRRGRGDRIGLTHVAFVAHSAGAAAVTFGGLCSGFVLPRFLADAPMAEFVFAINQAFARLFALASSAAIAAWSIADWRRGLSAWACGLGLVVGGAAAALVATGHLRLDVHGMTALVLGQSVWWGLVARGMLRRGA